MSTKNLCLLLAAGFIVSFLAKPVWNLVSGGPDDLPPEAMQSPLQAGQEF